MARMGLSVLELLITESYERALYPSSFVLASISPSDMSHLAALPPVCAALLKAKAEKGAYDLRCGERA